MKKNDFSFFVDSVDQQKITIPKNIPVSTVILMLNESQIHSLFTFFFLFFLFFVFLRKTITIKSIFYLIVLLTLIVQQKKT